MQEPDATGQVRTGERRSTEAQDAAERRGSRVVPLPLALVAVALPFIVAWAAPAERSQARLKTPELSEPLRALRRDTRVPEEPGGYVDVWGRPRPWEASWLAQRGYVEPK